MLAWSLNPWKSVFSVVANGQLRKLTQSVADGVSTRSMGTILFICRDILEHWA